MQTKAKRIAWWMLDGVGLAGPLTSNPFSRPEPETLGHFGVSRRTRLHDSEVTAHPVDARLGVAGLPQSGTGQTTLLTGVNAAAHLGHHHGPWPGPTLKPLLEESVPIWVARRGGRVRLANHYPARYLEAIASGKRRLNAIALAATKAGATLGDGIPPPLGHPDDLAATSPAQVRDWGRAFVTLDAELVIFDAWWTDHLGHLGSSDPQAQAVALEAGRDHAARLEAFFSGALEARPADTLLLITSDHGNFEDLSVKTHTMADVPLVAVGPGALEFEGVDSLTGVAAALRQALTI